MSPIPQPAAVTPRPWPRTPPVGTRDNLAPKWRTSVLAAVLLGAALAFPSPAAAAPGDLDPAFDGDGITTTDVGGSDLGVSMVLQPDGKIIMAGATFNTPNPGDFALARYNGDGSLDPSFDGDGTTTTDFSGTTDYAHDVVIQSDGKIIVAGSTRIGAFTQAIAIARYTQNGALDPTFDGDGKVSTSFGVSANGDSALAVTIQADGKIVVAGDTDSTAGPNDFAVARYNPDGTLDATFDGDGWVTTDFGRFDTAEDVVVQADGKIIAVGTTDSGAVRDMAVARYNPDGSLDGTFDGDGMVTVDFGAEDGANAVVVQSDGKIVVAGYAAPGSSALVRFRPDGSLDPGFDGDGRVLGQLNVAAGLVLQPDGKLVVSGNVWDVGDIGVARYAPDGAPDPGFASNGLATVDLGGSIDRAFKVAVQSDGKIVVGGDTNANATTDPYELDFAVVRLDAEPPCAKPPAGMVGWWPFDETTGSVAEDIWAGHDGNLIGQGASWAAGLVGGAIQFSGVKSNHLAVPDHDDFRFGPGQDFSIDTWVRFPPDTKPATPSLNPISILVDKRDPQTQRNGYILLVRQRRFELILLNGTGGGTTHYYTPSSKVNGKNKNDGVVKTGVWQHLAVTVDRDQVDGVRFYVDSIPVPEVGHYGDATLTLQYDLASSGALSIGGRWETGGASIATLDELEIFRSVVAPQDVKAIYDAGSSGKCRACAPDGLLAHWKADSNTVDSVGGLVGTPVGDTHYETGVLGNAFSFDGADDRVVIDPGPESDSFTIATWLYYRPDLNQWPWKAIYARGLRGLWLKGRAINYYEGGDRYIGALTVPLGEWTHVALTYDHATCTLTGYVNGVQDVSATFCGSALPSGNNLAIGGLLDWRPEDFHGLIDDVRVYSRALAVEEVLQLLNPCDN